MEKERQKSQESRARAGDRLPARKASDPAGPKAYRI
jgi:hypothetical protein